MAELSDDAPIQDANLCVRSENCLLWAGIKTVGQARRTADRKLLAIRNFGATCLRELRRELGPFICEDAEPPTKKFADEPQSSVTYRQWLVGQIATGALAEWNRAVDILVDDPSLDAHRETADSIVRMADTLIEALEATN